MTVNTLGLRGYGVDGFSVDVTLKIDSDGVGISSRSGGNRLVLRGRYDTSVTTSLSNPSVFADGKAVLVGIAGRITMENARNTLLIPWTSLLSRSDGIELNIPIHQSDIAWIEDARNGSDFNANIELHGLVAVKSGQPFFLNPQDSQKTTKVPWHVEESLGVSSNIQQFTIEREKWLNMVSQLGIGAYLVELPLIDLKKKKQEWRNVVGFFERASMDFKNGNYEDAIEECRKVVEGIVTVISGVWRLQPDPKHDFSQKVRSMLDRLRDRWPSEEHSKLEAVDQLINAIWKWSGPYHHYEGGLAHRQESSFVLHLTANLIELSGWILENNPDSQTGK